MAGGLAQAAEPAAGLGTRLRRMRQDRRLTLKDVASGAGLSAGFISQVERDIVAPSLSSLAAIAGVLDVPVGTLLPDVPPPPARTRSDERPIVRTGHEVGVHYERLSTVFPGATLNSVIIHEQPGHRSEPISHEGEELFYLLDGALTVEVDGHRTVLNAGDSLHISSRQRHSSWNHTDAPAAILHVCTMDVFGDRIPAEARPGLHENHAAGGARERKTGT